MKFTNYLTFKQNYQFKTVFHRGKNFVFPSLVVYIKKNNKNINRIGITVSKKIGSAVKRNRAKRVIVAAFKELSGFLGNGYDIVFVGRVRTTNCKMWEVKAHMQKAFTAFKNGSDNNEKTNN